VPQLPVTELAYTQQEKLKLMDKIKNKTHPDTDEGIIIYNLTSSVPKKAKIKGDYDILITGTYPAGTGTKYENNAIGGFVGTLENTNIVVRVGSGIDDATRRDAYQDPNKYVGLWAKIESPRRLSSGQLFQPVFKELRYEKF